MLPLNRCRLSRMKQFLIGALLSLVLLIGCTAKEPADLLLFNGTIFTADQKLTTHSVMAVTDGKVSAMGDASLKDRFNAYESVDLCGRLIIPGFNDTHQHVFGQSHRYVALEEVRSIEELKDLIRSKAAELGEGEWITGYGWAEDDLSENQRPLRWDLDEAAPMNPVILARAGDHSAVVNSLALNLAGIDRNTPDPEGGIIERDEKGELNGIIRERQNIVGRLVPKATWEELKPSFMANLRGLLSFGITSFIQAGATVEQWHQWQEVYAEFGDELPRAAIQIYWAGREAMEAWGLKTGDGDSRLRIGAVKVLVDGGFTGPAAYTLEPYRGRPDYFGKLNHSEEELRRIVLDAHKIGWQLGFHAIGDAAIKMTVELFVDALGLLPRKDHRHYLNHFTVSPPEETYQLMAENNILIAQQPNFTWTLDRRYSESLDGERLQHNNPLRTPMDYGIFMALGSDILPTDPFLGIYEAVTRRGKSGRIFAAEEKLSIEEAVVGYTRNGAYITFEEDTKGSLEVGKVADFVVLSQNLFELSNQSIRTVTVEQTYLGGKLVYDQESPD